MRKRLDVVLAERGLAETRSQAQALVLAGLVAGYEKPGQQVDEDAELTVEQPPRFVSRGGGSSRTRSPRSASTPGATARTGLRPGLHRLPAPGRAARSPRSTSGTASCTHASVRIRASRFSSG
jgi:ribosomal protein S4